MRESELDLLQALRTTSRYSIVAGILISLILYCFGGFPMELQVSLALIALMVGIPHGAVDHLVTVPKIFGLKMALFLGAYLAVVALAVLFLLNQNILGFQLVVLMSAIHFGVGDAAFISEIDKRAGRTNKWPKLAFAFVSGFTPVVIPLVNSQSTQALTRVKPTLVDWVGNLGPGIFMTMLALALTGIVLMGLSKRWPELLDLALLLTLALVAPPLVAFALYFGLWHALRHTGRLTLELEISKKRHEMGQSTRALFDAFLAGIPALVVTLVGTLILGLSRGFVFNQEYLWYLLVVVWALTVPHMILTARLDARAIRT